MTAPADARRSEDGNYWWDGAEWRQLSDDGHHYWDGAQWHPAEDSAPASSSSAAVSGGGPVCEPVSVHHSVSLVAQPTDTSCWAASIAMLVGETPQAVVDRVGLEIDGSYGWDQIEPAARQWGLTPLYPACGMPDLLASWLYQHGPLWVVEIGAPYHAVVVGGIEGDGTEDGTYVTVYNPWPPNGGAVEQETFRKFESDFELGAGANAALLHR
ncbi:papain-like cysteine protease family protein [Spirilliplanes yamanashiensis]|uniref:Uncharacterized protein n=1 Tax=Spirilliplanes yamanashiensis TaxID=42233 RepID=A0A8J3YBL5_9ACTN|nr:papain-like cysteine protease family protein [Spirilliplanes yamanashiensis]MDP9818087.1 hypothetical protein [Spirilliplanes yamanashiensis]GIJ04897.1 hypothetical protein Sya03_42490 [Spirilliplanes yamanashiensis]